MGHKIFARVLTYRDNFSVVWKTMRSVFFCCCCCFFLRLFFGFQRIDFCDIQPILLDVFEYILDHCSTHFFGSVSFTPRCIAFQSCVVKCSHWCQYFSPSSESLTSFSPTNCGFNIWRGNFMAIFSFRSNIFVGRMVKKKGKNPTFFATRKFMKTK